MDGIFAGYEMGPGYQWNGIHTVWPLEDFVNADLSTFSRAMHHRHRYPHIVKVVELPTQGVWYPLRGEYERVNHTLEGIRETEEAMMEPRIYDPPHWGA